MEKLNNKENLRDDQRQEIHNTIWKIADKLRGSVDGWDFKSYVLGTMFYRYISENITKSINDHEHSSGYADFDYAKLSDEEAENAREWCIDTKGFFILPSQLFCNVTKNAENDKDINTTLSNAFKAIEKSAEAGKGKDNFAGLFDDFQVNDKNLGSNITERNKKLRSLLESIAQMQLSEDYQDNHVDPFGDAYEYLMGMYASRAGKSGGEYFTPQEVSKLLTLLCLDNKKEVKNVYDPACGSGSLLLQTAKILGKNGSRQGYYGQELNLTTYNLCKMNMFLHNIPFDKFKIINGDTLINPETFGGEKFEVIVSNPPYSIGWEGDNNKTLINDERFAPAGVLAPKKNSDFAFIMHAVYYLANNGTAAIVCFPGILYRNGAEKQIRQYLVNNNFIDAIIALPGNLFYGTNIETCIMVLKKDTRQDKNILFIDAHDQFTKVTNKNKLTQENIQVILDAYKNRKDELHRSKLVSIDKISQQNYSLSVSKYVEQKVEKEEIDIDQLNQELDAIVKREEELRKQIADIIKEIEK